MISTYNSILKYLRHPFYEPIVGLSIGDKLKTVGHALVICFIFVFISAIPIYIIGETNIIDLEEHATSQLFENYSPIVILFLAAIVAPIMEELIFRAPLYLFRKVKKNFKYIFYGVALIFGFIHISNYDITTTSLLLSPLLVAPQIIAGLILGYVRIRLGLPYSILLHSMFNGLAIIPSVLFM